MDWNDIEHAAIALHKRAGFDPAQPRGGPALARALFGELVIARGSRTHVRGSNDGPRITIAKRISPADLNFATCHEIAEHELSRARLRSSDVERLADAFAACIAAPAPAVRLAFFALRWNLPRLARAFCLTETAIALRIGEVLGEPVAVVRPVRVDRRGPDELPDDTVLRGLVRVRIPLLFKTGPARDCPDLSVTEIGDAPRRALVATG